MYSLQLFHFSADLFPPFLAFPSSLSLSNIGTALMGIGHGKGKLRATDAALSAISSPLLGFPIYQARGIVFNIVGGPDMTLQEINR